MLQRDPLHRVVPPTPPPDLDGAWGATDIILSVNERLLAKQKSRDVST